MKKLLLTLITILSPLFLWAQTDVTAKYLDNPDFEARFAGWENAGMTFQTNNSFGAKNGMVYMEKYVASGKVGTASIKRTLVGMEPGTYTLVAGAQNIQSSSATTEQTGAVIFAGDEQTAVSPAGDYAVTFTVLRGHTEIGFKASGATGNWVCADNFRLYYKGIVKDSVNIELQKLIDEAESVVGDGVTGPALRTAIDEAKALLTAEGDYEAVAKSLARATLAYRIANGTGSVPKVVTNPYVAQGVTIALGRMSVTGTSKERGFCWSTEPEPTVLDNRSTRYFTNNGNIYCMEHMQPGTVYYVRAYAITSGWQVGYGDVVKIATLPKGNITTTYDYAGDEQQNYRIASAVNEVKWMYDNLANIRSFNLNVHYVYGAGAGGGTADCSYGGWMRVSQNAPYQQTGTILHETNHGVGVGTTPYWYNNSNLRSNTSSGLWLGPRATQMIQFLQNDATAFLQGDGTHMWGGSANSSITMVAYGINGAHEDTYNPINEVKYYGNILITHALHQDGMACSSSVGYATPAYVFQQDDAQKYYLTSEDDGTVTFLTMTSTGALRMQNYDAENSDNFAWHITYDPKTSYYVFQNVGTGKYLTYSSAIKAATKSTVSSTEKFHLLPARSAVSVGDFTGTGYWITYNRGEYVLQEGTTNTTTTTLNFANSATNQRWLFLTEDEMKAYSAGIVGTSMVKLDELLANVEKAVATPHLPKAEDGDLDEIDNELGTLVKEIKTAKESYVTPAEVATAISDVEAALVKFLAKVKVADMAQPIDLTFLLTNPGLDENSDGWSTSAAWNYSCCEFYQTTFDFNQTTALKMPAGTYELRVQAYQRPGAASASYTDYAGGADNVTTYAYLKTKTQKVKNIWADGQKRTLGGSTSNAGGLYVPNNMLAASKWFAAGWYDNSVMLKTTSAATMKLGIRCTSSSDSYWTCFDNFRLYYYGDYTVDYITAVDDLTPAPSQREGAVYDLSGRRVSRPAHGPYIQGGRKVVIK